MKLSIVVAVAENGVIGRDDGVIPWRIKTDMKHFRSITQGHPIIMGRKTFDTFKKPLKDRLHIVITRDKSYELPEGFEDCVVVNDLKDALRAASSTGTDEAFVIGGGQIYAELLPLTTTIHLTRVHAQPQGEALFTYNADEWDEIEREEHGANPELEDQFAFTFITLKRKSS